MTKSERHNKILDIVKNNHVETQEDLTKLLCECGFEVTQATVSRDIKALKLVKVAATDENGARIGYKYAQGSQQGIAGELTEKFRNLRKKLGIGDSPVFPFRDRLSRNADKPCELLLTDSLLFSELGNILSYNHKITSVKKSKALSSS